MWAVYFLTATKFLLLVPYAKTNSHALLLLLCGTAFLFLSYYAYASGVRDENKRLLRLEREEQEDSVRDNVKNSLDVGASLIKDFLMNENTKKKRKVRKRL
tara:strand:- start:10373 stop:10675 length:303 start_codon:yes stop_codon:yes gene_type:complete